MEIEINHDQDLERRNVAATEYAADIRQKCTVYLKTGSTV
jgi:hypothetical protein